MNHRNTWASLFSAFLFSRTRIPSVQNENVSTVCAINSRGLGPSPLPCRFNIPFDLTTTKRANSKHTRWPRNCCKTNRQNRYRQHILLPSILHCNMFYQEMLLGVPVTVNKTDWSPVGTVVFFLIEADPSIVWCPLNLLYSLRGRSVKVTSVHETGAASAASLYQAAVMGV